MKSLFLASVIAVASTISFGAVAQAQSTVTKPHVPAGSRLNSPNYMDRKCTVKTVRRHRNGQTVLEKVKTCH